jgi:hypothetical protein
VAVTTDWLVSFAQREPDAKLLTHHFYAGVATSPDATIDNLLQSNAAFEALLASIGPASQTSGIPYRIDEINSMVLGGKPGVSDTFASALWGLDVMFTLATAGGTGLNLENGLNQFDAISSYSPIVQDTQGNWVPRPLYYGMLAFALAGQGDLVTSMLGPSSINIKAYATSHSDGTLWVVLINKDLSQTAKVSLGVSGMFGGGNVLRLTAPAVDSTDGVSLGGAAVASNGTWAATATESINVGSAIEIPPASAALVQLRPLAFGAEIITRATSGAE